MKELYEFGLIVRLIQSQREKLPGFVRAFRRDYAEHKELQRMVDELIELYAEELEPWLQELE